MSRREAGGGTKPNMKTEMPYIFGSTVLVLRHKLDRGVPGSLDKGPHLHGEVPGQVGCKRGGQPLTARGGTAASCLQ